MSESKPGRVFRVIIITARPVCDVDDGLDYFERLDIAQDRPLDILLCHRVEYG
jgi:hypothetical protein